MERYERVGYSTTTNPDTGSPGGVILAQANSCLSGRAYCEQKCVTGIGKRSAESKHEHRTKQRRLREESAQAVGGGSLARGALAGGVCGAAPLYGVPSPYIQGALAGEIHHYTFGLEAPAALEDHTDGTDEQAEDDADTGWALSLIHI